MESRHCVICGIKSPRTDTSELPPWERQDWKVQGLTIRGYASIYHHISTQDRKGRILRSGSGSWSITISKTSISIYC